jgi:hypothetical protein
MSEAPVVQTEKQTRWSPLRIALFTVLAVAIVALAIDLAARIPANRAYGKLNAMLDEEDIGESDLSMQGPRTPAEIHKVLGLEPTDSERQTDKLRETYRWQGVFRAYTVHTVYTGAVLDLSNPTNQEPLLTQVGYMAPPE